MFRKLHFITMCFPFLCLLWCFLDVHILTIDQHIPADSHLSQYTLTHLWHLSFSYWSSSCPSQLMPHSGASILPPGTQAQTLAVSLHLHCPAQALHPHLQLLLQGQQQVGRPQVLSPVSHRGWTASQLSGNHLGSLGTVCHREGRLRVARLAPDRSRRSPCRPGTQASGVGRKGPAGRVTADWVPRPLSEGSSCSPKLGCWGGHSACSCLPADPCWLLTLLNNVLSPFLGEEFKTPSCEVSQDWKSKSLSDLRNIQFAWLNAHHYFTASTAGILTFVRGCWLFHSPERVRIDALLWQRVSLSLWEPLVHTLSHTFSLSCTHTPSLPDWSDWFVARQESCIRNSMTPLLGLAVFTTLLRHSWQVSPPPF